MSLLGSSFGIGDLASQAQAQSNAAAWQQNALAQQQFQGFNQQQVPYNSCSKCGEHWFGPNYAHECRIVGLITTASTVAPKADTLPKKEKKMSMVKEYMNKHRDIIFTLIGAMLIDHFLLGGALRKRIQAVCEAVLTKVENALGLPGAK